MRSEEGGGFRKEGYGGEGEKKKEKRTHKKCSVGALLIKHLMWETEEEAGLRDSLSFRLHAHAVESLGLEVI